MQRPHPCSTSCLRLPGCAQRPGARALPPAGTAGRPSGPAPAPGSGTASGWLQGGPTATASVRARGETTLLWRLLRWTCVEAKRGVAWAQRSAAGVQQAGRVAAGSPREVRHGKEEAGKEEGGGQLPAHVVSWSRGHMVTWSRGLSSIIFTPQPHHHLSLTHTISLSLSTTNHLSLSRSLSRMASAAQGKAPAAASSGGEDQEEYQNPWGRDSDVGDLVARSVQVRGPQHSARLQSWSRAAEPGARPLRLRALPRPPRR
jgi:hypothetical protein